MALNERQRKEQAENRESVEDFFLYNDSQSVTKAAAVTGLSLTAVERHYTDLVREGILFPRKKRQ